MGRGFVYQGFAWVRWVVEALIQNASLAPSLAK